MPGEAMQLQDHVSPSAAAGEGRKCGHLWAFQASILAIHTYWL